MDVGRDTLADLGRQIVTEQNWHTLYPYADEHFTQMPYYVDVFLRSLRAAFPCVVLEVILGPESEFVRVNRANHDSVLDDFVARDSDILYIDYDVDSHFGCWHHRQPFGFCSRIN